MQAHGLYFPYIHIRDDDWLKTAALYWPTVRRLVPRHHQTHDTPTARAFAEADVLRSEDPILFLVEAGFDLLAALEANVDRLASRYRVAPSNDPAHVDYDTGRGLFVAPEYQHLGWVHLEKFPPGAVDLLEYHGLAIRGRYEPVWSESRYRHGAPQNWIGLHPAVAGAYMTALAGRVSEHAGLQPITDQSDPRAAVPLRDVEAALQLLMGPTPRLAQQDGIDRYVMLAVQAVAPRHLSAVSPDVILRCRETLKEELETFRDHVAKQADELAEIASLTVEHRHLEAFSEHVQKHIEKPLQQLEHGLNLLRLPTIRTMLTANALAPPAIIATPLAALDQPVIGTAGGAAAIVWNAWWGAREDRAKLRTDSPVGYLLGVREHLAPQTFANRVRKLWAGTYR